MIREVAPTDSSRMSSIPGIAAISEQTKGNSLSVTYSVFGESRFRLRSVTATRHSSPSLTPLFEIMTRVETYRHGSDSRRFRRRLFLR